MSILAIDPGPEYSAFVLRTDSGAFPYRGKVPEGEIYGIIDRTKPGIVVVEHLQCFGMAVGAEVFETAYNIGSIRKYCALLEVPFGKIFRGNVKMHICQSMRATDANIRRAILDRFGGEKAAIGRKQEPGPLYGISGDMWSALAIAITWSETKSCNLSPTN